MERYGGFSLVLHSHIPLTIGYGIWPHGVDWLYEAAAESYLPILKTFERLSSEGIPFAVTLGLTPILIEQMNSIEFREGFKEYLEMKGDAAMRDEVYLSRKGDEGMRSVAVMWIEFYRELLEYYREGLGEDIVRGFGALRESGCLELLGGSLTHCYSPLLSLDSSIHAQMRGGGEVYTRNFGSPPRGIWLPECGYRPRGAWQNPVTGDEVPSRAGVEEILHDARIEYFFIDTHLLRGGKPINHYADRFQIPGKIREKGVSPRFVENRYRVPWTTYYVSSGEGGKRVVVFTRDPHTSLQVWSGEHGYPGEADYLDFHKKHHTTGLRYWRVTDPKADLAAKTLYDPDRVEDCVRRHADHFAGIIHSTLENYHRESGRRGIVVSPFDTELFGHWWFEGPSFIYEVMKRISRSPMVEAMRCSDYLEETGPAGTVSIPEGSWGDGGYHRMWWNHETEWTWELIYEAEKRLSDLLPAWMEKGREGGTLSRLFSLTAQELLALQSSDWQFLITTGSAKDYSIKRFMGHWERFNSSTALLERGLGRGMVGKDDMELIISGRFLPFMEILGPELWAPQP